MDLDDISQNYHRLTLSATRSFVTSLHQNVLGQLDWKFEFANKCFTFLNFVSKKTDSGVVPSRISAVVEGRIPTINRLVLMTRAERAKIFHFVYVVYDEVLFFGELDKSKAQTFLLIFLFIYNIYKTRCISLHLGACRYTQCLRNPIA